MLHSIHKQDDEPSERSRGWVLHEDGSVLVCNSDVPN